MYMSQYFNFFLFFILIFLFSYFVVFLFFIIYFYFYFIFFVFLFLDLLDLEDIGVAMRKQKQTEKKAKEASLRLEARDGGREMVTKLQRRALTKEGYRIIGTHSAVKLCRWTKVQQIFIFFTFTRK